jgi:hypothetical protein
VAIGELPCEVREDVGVSSRMLSLLRSQIIDDRQLIQQAGYLRLTDGLKKAATLIYASN